MRLHTALMRAAPAACSTVLRLDLIRNPTNLNGVADAPAGENDTGKYDRLGRVSRSPRSVQAGERLPAVMAKRQPPMSSHLPHIFQAHGNGFRRRINRQLVRRYTGQADIRANIPFLDEARLIIRYRPDAISLDHSLKPGKEAAALQGLHSAAALNATNSPGRWRQGLDKSSAWQSMGKRCASPSTSRWASRPSGRIPLERQAPTMPASCPCRLPDNNRYCPCESGAVGAAKEGLA